jgi:hypothetical protein
VVGPPASLQTIHKDDDDEVHDGISCSGFEFPVALWARWWGIPEGWFMIHHGQLRIPNLDSTIFEVQCCLPRGTFKSGSWYGATPSSWMESSKSSFFTLRWVKTLVPSGFTSNQLVVAFDPRKYDSWILFPYFLCQCPYNPWWIQPNPGLRAHP